MRKITETIKKIKSIDARILKETQRRLDSLTKPRGSLGRLEELAKTVVAVTGRENPTLDRKVVFTMVGDHGVAREGVSAFPQEVTLQMVYNFLQGGAAVNVLARGVGAKVLVIDMGVAGKIKSSKELINKKVASGTQDMMKGAAMSREQALQSIRGGIQVFEEEAATGGVDITGTGDMGIANTTSSSAIVACITGSRVQDVTGRGTGIDDEQLRRKIEVIEKALKINQPDPHDPLDILSKVGGFEIGGLVGCILAAAAHRVPIVIDGFISTASALIACELCPSLKDYLIAAHRSQEKGHQIALNHLGKIPLLELNMRLGEGTGAVLGMKLVELGVKILNEMATFEAARVSREEKLN
ncbi:MAG: nicotinate-nucleotide--dimethylbenzimidazole phosphoribosyltransferase [bacterium]